MMFKHLIEENGLKKEMKRYGLDDRDLKFIEELIEGKETCEGRSEDKWFLTEVLFWTVNKNMYNVHAYWTFIHSIDCCQQENWSRCRQMGLLSKGLPWLRSCQQF